MRAGQSLLLVAITLLLTTVSACDLTRFTANSTSKMFERAGTASESFFDYEIAMQSMAGNIAQLEGLLSVVPDNEVYTFLLMRAYIAYSYGYVEDLLDQAEMDGDFRESEYQSHRAKLLYLRSRDLGFHWISQRHSGLQDAINGGLDEFERWLERFDEDDVDMLLWTGYAWGSAVNQGKNDMDLVADFPFAKAMIERSVELGPEHYNSAGYTFLAVAATEAMSGNPEDGREIFERALRQTERRSLIIQYNYAKSYAIKTQNRELFIELLREVVEAGDVDPGNRLSNILAKRKALRLLRRIDEFFP